MNKHKKTAIVTAFLALCASFAFWTYRIGIVVHVVAEEVPSEEHVENLGSHFAQNITKPVVAASVVSVQQEEKQEQVQKEEGEQEQKDDDEQRREQVEEVTHPAAPSELTQWELQRAWGISVPTLGIRAPVLLPSQKYWSSRAWDLMEEQMQVGLNYGTVAYPHSVAPGGNGSLIIAGHSSPPTEASKRSIYGDVFAQLPAINIGEDVTISSGGRSITYTVEDKIIVKPSEVSILEQQDDESLLKLITCYPVGTTKNRMIIIAKKTAE